MLKLGELVAYLRADKDQFDRTLQDGKREFKGANDEMDRGAATAAAAVAASWATKLAEVRQSSQASRVKFTADADATKAKLIELAQEYERTGKKSLLKDMSSERAQLRQLTAAVNDLNKMEAEAAAGFKQASAAAATELSKVEEAAARVGEGSGFERASQSVRAFETGIEASRSRLRELAQEFDRTGNKSLLKDMSSERSKLKQLEQAAAELGTGGFAAARNALNNFGTVATNVISNVWNLIPVILALAAAAMFTVPAVGLLGGALGSLPALSVGVGAGIGVLALGFMGLSDQFKKTSSAGGAVVDTAWQIASAERRVRDANLEVLASQEALTRARETAAKRMDDLNRSLRGARVDEKGAVIAVADAEKALADARRSGTKSDEEHAQQALDQAKQSLEDIRARLQDMEQEQQRNTKTGVEGSDEVKSALDRQRKAVEGVTDAEHALAEARKPAPGGGGGAAADIMRIAPNAAAAVAAIKALRPAFDDLRLDVQQRLFAGVGGEIKALAASWLPMLHDKLGGMASTANRLFHEFADSAKKPEFITRIGEGLDAVDRLVGKVGSAVAGPFVDAWGRLTAASSPFLDAVGDELAGIITDFSLWIKKADESGTLKDFFKKAGDFFRDVTGIGKDAAGILGDIMSTVFSDPKNANGGNAFESLKKNMDELKAWFDNPDNQKKMRDWFQALQDIGTVILWVGGVIGWLVVAHDKAIRWIIDQGNILKEAFTIVFNWIGDRWNEMVGWVEKMPGRIGKAASGMWNGIKDEFTSAVNWIIRGWNRLQFTIGGGTFLGQTFPSMTLSTPNIPMLKDGGIVRATPGGRMVGVAEGGQDEVVAPLDKLAAMMRGRGGGTTRVVAETDDDLLSLLFRSIRWKVKSDFGGSVDAAFAGV